MEKMRFAHGEGDAAQKTKTKLKTETERSGKAKNGEASVVKSLGAEGRRDVPAAHVLPLFHAIGLPPGRPLALTERSERPWVFAARVLRDPKLAAVQAPV